MMLYTLFAGIIASSIHVISGPDHLAAVAPLVVETKRSAWKIGLSWGLGHVIGMLLIGVLFLIFKEYIPIEIISQYSEQLVAVILIGLGILTFYRIYRKQKTHKHPHIHFTDEPFIHIHKHNHIQNEKEVHEHTHVRVVKQNIIGAFAIGLVHGLAGVAHFILLLPALSFPSKTEGIQYIVGFALGSILAMSLYALILSKITYFYKQKKGDSLFNAIRFSAGLFAIIIGFYWLYSA